MKHSDIADTDSCSRKSERGSVIIISVAAGGVMTSTTTATISFSDSSLRHPFLLGKLLRRS